MASAVAEAGFQGLYIDANAISPATARAIAERFEHFVDGSVIGPPAHKRGTTRLYLSGSRAAEVAAWYDGSALDARVIGEEQGAASALKMAYASWTKIGSAMNLAIRALAQAEGVDAALVDEWNISQPGMVDRSELVAAAVSPKAWRFTGEMEQIAASLLGRRASPPASPRQRTRSTSEWPTSRAPIRSRSIKQSPHSTRRASKPLRDTSVAR